MQRKCDSFLIYYDTFCQELIFNESKYICNNTINLFSFRNTTICISGSKMGDDEFKIR